MYPQVNDKEMIGSYPALVKAGGGYVWNEVLEYRVWCHPEHGSEDIKNGEDYYYVFDSFEEAFQFSQTTIGAEEPIALILQKEYIDEPEPNILIHIKEERLTEWPVEFLNRPRRTENTISDFLSPDAPSNRLDILRGMVH